ncbi:MAG TPA: DUF3631 domain-containing protein [candidate division Zixibacteria bacterium]|nr:DUF3631 domain-containing protein [candidate division Zixibacteria bacterium]
MKTETPRLSSDGVRARLHQDHYADLKISGLDDATIGLMNLRSVVPRDVPGFESGLYARVESVLEFPYPNVPGFSRFKLFPPLETANGTIKYFQPPGSDNHLYILPSVLEKISNIKEPLFFVEGEKKAAAAVQAGLNAVGFAGIWNWLEAGTWTGIEDLKSIPLVDREVSIVPDSDVWLRDDLQRAVYALARFLDSRGAKVLVVVLPQTGSQKVGLDDYLAAHSLDDLSREKWLPLKHPTLKQHKTWYETWRREKIGGVGRSEKKALIVDDEPVESTVDTAEQLDLLMTLIKRYVVLSDDAAAAAALWVLHAWALDAFDVSPYLFLTSPTKRCGKTTLLEILAMLSPRALPSSNITGPALFRAIEKFKPSLFIDEADSFLGDKDELRGIINSGHHRASAFVLRCVGDDHEPQLFSTWCPKAIAAIGRLAATLEDRSVVIGLKRRAPGERVDRFRSTGVAKIAEPLRRRSARWALDNVERLRALRPDAPAALHDRAADNWRPLLAIAELAGGEWPDRARAAAIRVSGTVDEGGGSALVQLLEDLRVLFEENSSDRLFSADICSALANREDRPWSEWRSGKPITPRQLARLLGGVGITPKLLRAGEGLARGYERSQFDDAFARYTPPDPLHHINPSEINNLEPLFDPLQVGFCNTSKSDVSTRKINGNSVVTDEKGGLEKRVLNFDEEEGEL